MGESILSRGALQLRSEPGADTYEVLAFGDLDLHTVDLLEDEMQRVEGTDASRVVLDLSGLDFVDSIGMRLLLQLTTRPIGARLRLRRGKGQVERVLKVSCVDEALPFAN